MAAKTFITEAEFLRMTFDGPEPDFVDGELVERSMPNLEHGDIQSILCALLFPWRVASPRLFTLAAVRIRTAPRHYRVPNVSIFRGSKPVALIPETPPLVTLEIVSPDDAYTELFAKLREYRDLGVAHIWVIDPAFRTLSVFDERNNLINVDAFEIPDCGLRITAAQLFE